MVQGYLYNDCGGQHIKETDHCAFLLWVGEPSAGPGTAGRPQQRRHQHGPFLPCLLPRVTGSSPKFVKVTLEDHSVDLSLILDSEARSGQYLTDLCFSQRLLFTGTVTAPAHSVEWNPARCIVECVMGQGWLASNEENSVVK